MLSSQFYETVNDPVQNPSLKYEGNALRGALFGLIPLGFLLLLVAVTVLLPTLTRQLMGSSGFFVQQRASLIVLIAGLVMAMVVYVVAFVRTLRNVITWQRRGALSQARATLLALGVTALVVLLPAVLALVLPQHPAP